ncbi:MAG TPA: T9SS type A sorting domain-containing protein, partial [Candidatus Kapabacteria bacterium]|nr:T9SS type A sorting domain-containing protein [Candidatus Kapabacteria bacterium]
FGGVGYMWRNDDMTQIPLGSNQQQTQGWNQITNTTVASGSISAIAISTTPANRLYYGTSTGLLYRLDDADNNNSTPTAITGSGFPSGGYINCIAIDSKNADNAIVVFSNYNVQSLFYTSNGGASWKPIGGNLEQYPDGSGNGPSCRWASIMHVGNSVTYLVGTSTGLYSTAYLNDTATVWALEGASTIGNNIVAMIDTRESDGLVAIASHGAGIFTGNITSVPSAPGEPSLTFPTDGSVNMPQNTVMTWNSDPSVFYNLQVAKDAGFNNIVYQKSLIPGSISGVTTDTATGLEGQTTYYWRVQAANSGGVSPFSTVWNFATIVSIPAVPSLISPPTGASGVPVKPTLQWSSVTGASLYHLQISSSYSFASPIIDDSLITGTSYVPAGLAANKRYYWRAGASNVVGQGSYSPIWIFTTGTAGVHGSDIAPQAFTLEQNYPNPFSSSTNFTFAIAEESMTTLKVYNVLGKEVATVVSAQLPPGIYTAQWSAGDLPRGIYFYRLQSGAAFATKQMTLIK